VQYERAWRRLAVTSSLVCAMLDGRLGRALLLRMEWTY